MAAIAERGGEMTRIRREQTGLAADTWHSLRVGVVVLAALMAALFGPQYLQDREARFLPVVLPVTILSVQAVPGGVQIAATTEKLRDCNWRQTIFYLGRRDGANVLLTTAPHRDPPRVNGPGHLVWDNIFVPGIRPDQVDQTFADAFHQCHWLYDSRSNFWN